MSESFRSYRDLEVWKRSMAVAKLVYSATNSFPNDERFGLVSQMRRAAVSIPSNLAEGHSRFGPGEFRQFISIARGSLAELETQIILSVELGYMQSEVSHSLLSDLDTLGKMLRGLQRAIEGRKDVAKSAK